MRGSMIALTAVLMAGPLTPHADAESLREVQNRVASVLAHPGLATAQVGVLAVSLGRGEEIYRHNAGTPLIPASTMKLVTVATALELLGAGYDCSAVEGARSGETLAALASRIIKPSNNELADALLAALPVAAGRTELTPRQLCAETWGERGLYLHGAHWNDGSGLSRSDMMSAELVVGLLQAMHRSRWRDTVIAAMPLAGVDGTLRSRMLAGPAYRRVRAKTGTLTGVSALSGYADTAGGERLAFATIMNGFTCERERVRRMQDHICEALVCLDREDVRSEPAARH